MLAANEMRNMKANLLFQEKHALLKSKLHEKLQRKHTLEMEIREQYQELKRLETSLEKQISKTTPLEQQCLVAREFQHDKTNYIRELER